MPIADVKSMNLFPNVPNTLNATDHPSPTQALGESSDGSAFNEFFKRSKARLEGPTDNPVNVAFARRADELAANAKTITAELSADPSPALGVALIHASGLNQITVAATTHLISSGIKGLQQLTTLQ